MLNIRADVETLLASQLSLFTDQYIVYLCMCACEYLFNFIDKH